MSTVAMVIKVSLCVVFAYIGTMEPVWILHQKVNLQ